MDTKSRLEAALRDAMRARDDVAKRTIRLTMTTIRLAEVEKGQALDEAGLLAVLQKELKNRQEAIVDAERAKRPDLAAENEAEIVVLKSFLPQQLTPADLEALAREVIAEAGASAPGDMGKVMKALTPRLQGRASGAEASAVVRRLLQNG
jgi:hypothetical protein